MNLKRLYKINIVLFIYLFMKKFFSIYFDESPLLCSDFFNGILLILLFFTNFVIICYYSYLGWKSIGEFKFDFKLMLEYLFDIKSILIGILCCIILEFIHRLVCL